MATHTSLKGFLYRVYRKSRKLRMRYSGNPRPISLPFVSGDTFRELAQHVYEEPVPHMDPDAVAPGDIVFVRVEFVRRFIDSVHPLIRNKYVLITHNGDDGVGEEFASFLGDEKLIAWFAQNVLVRHEKLHPIPIGLENESYCSNGVVRNFVRLRASLDQVKKRDRILYGFSVGTNPAERQPALDFLRTSELADSLQGWPIPIDYLKTLRQYKFVASPPGNGIDCIRTWEAMLLRTVPIVKRSVMTEYFAGLGLPMMLVDDWDELTSWDEGHLAGVYDKLEPAFSSPYLMFDVWKDMIDSVRGQSGVHS